MTGAATKSNAVLLGFCLLMISSCEKQTTAAEQLVAANPAGTINQNAGNNSNQVGTVNGNVNIYPTPVAAPPLPPHASTPQELAGEYGAFQRPRDVKYIRDEFENFGVVWKVFPRAPEREQRTFKLGVDDDNLVFSEEIFNVNGFQGGYSKIHCRTKIRHLQPPDELLEYAGKPVEIQLHCEADEACWQCEFTDTTPKGEKSGSQKDPMEIMNLAEGADYRGIQRAIARLISPIGSPAAVERCCKGPTEDGQGRVLN